MDDCIKISVITVAWNAARTIDETIRSVLEQSYPEVEYIVIDGDSTDGTQDIVRSYGSKISVFLSEKDKGIYDAMNKGIKLATGDLICFLNADDVYADTEVFAKVAEVATNSGCDAIYGDLIGFNDKPGKPIRYWRSGAVPENPTRSGWVPPHPSFFIRRESISDTLLFDTSFRISADFDFFVRFLAAHPNLAYLPEPLVRMKLGGASNGSLRSHLKANRECLRSLYKNNVSMPWLVLVRKLSRKIPQFFIASPSA